MLPALTPYSPGLDVMSEACIGALRAWNVTRRDLHVVAATSERVFPFGTLSALRGALHASARGITQTSRFRRRLRARLTDSYRVQRGERDQHRGDLRARRDAAVERHRAQLAERREQHVDLLGRGRGPATPVSTAPRARKRWKDESELVGSVTNVRTCSSDAAA